MTKKRIDTLSALDYIPHPLVIVTAGDPENPNERGGMTAAWVSRISWNPPLVMVAIAPSRHTLKLIRKQGSFALNIVSKALENAAYSVFGMLSGKNVDKFSAAKVTVKPAERIKAPVIAEAPVVIECEKIDEVKAGDHIMIIGEVVNAYINSDDTPLVFYQSRSGELNV